MIISRHGESETDLDDRLGGKEDDNLTPKGVEQAKSRAGYLKGRFKVTRIKTSPLKRASQTANIYGEAFGVVPELVSSLRECDRYAEFSGRPRSEAIAAYPDLMAALKTDYRAVLPGGENYDDFSDRVLRTFARLTNSELMDETMLVTHGGPFKCFLREALKLPEITRLDDCAFVEVHLVGGELILGQHDGVEWAVV